MHSHVDRRAVDLAVRVDVQALAAVQQLKPDAEHRRCYKWCPTGVAWLLPVVATCCGSCQGHLHLPGMPRREGRAQLNRWPADLAFWRKLDGGGAAGLEWGRAAPAGLARFGLLREDLCGRAGAGRDRDAVVRAACADRLREVGGGVCWWPGEREGGRVGGTGGVVDHRPSCVQRGELSSEMCGAGTAEGCDSEEHATPA